MKLEIDLEIKHGEGSPISASYPPSEDYPEVYLRGNKELNLPEEGKITFEYCVIEEKSSERRGESSYSCTLQLKKILDVEPEKDIRPSKADKSTEDALDALAKMKDQEENDDDTEEGDGY